VAQVAAFPACTFHSLASLPRALARGRLSLELRYQLAAAAMQYTDSDAEAWPGWRNWQTQRT
jgi:hypothetical protein